MVRRGSREERECLKEVVYIKVFERWFVIGGSRFFVWLGVEFRWDGEK